MMKIENFSQGKNSTRNEDLFGFNEKCFVVADGATDKSGQEYNGQTGGELISRLVVQECLDTNLNGIKLVNHLNQKISELYNNLQITPLIADPKFRFGCCFACARLLDDHLIITSLGDVGFRINEKEVHQNFKQIDISNSEARSEYIKRTGDILGSREYIEPLLLKQFEYSNNDREVMGYGVLDGTQTPEKFIYTFTYKSKEISVLELFSDGYFDIPQHATIKDWEELHEKVQREDPDKYKKYKSTKSGDDRTILIVNF